MERILIIIIATLILSSPQLWAQKIRGQKSATDVVYLKNGSIYRGQIVEYEYDKLLKIKINEATTISIPADVINKVVQIDPEERKGKLREKINPKITKKLYSMTNFYTLGGYFANEFELGLGAQTSFGYQWNSKLATGIGVAYDNYLIGSRTTLLPIFAEVRGQLTEKAVAPHYTVNIGYGFGVANEDFGIREPEGGLYLHGAMGLIFHKPGGHAFLLDVGYKFQELNYQVDLPWGTRDDFEAYDILFKRLSIRFGVIF